MAELCKSFCLCENCEVNISASDLKHNLETTSKGILLDISQKIDFEIEVHRNGMYAVTAFGEPVGERAFCCVELTVGKNESCVFTVVGKDAEKGIGGTSRAIYLSKGKHNMTLMSRGGRGGMILEKINISLAKEKNPNSYKPTDEREFVYYEDRWDKEEHSVYKTIYVSPGGNDLSDGSKDSPFKTLKRAKDEVSACRNAMSGDIVVILKEGCYELSETEIFTPKHGGANGFYVHYRGESKENPSVISGGVRIDGWEKYDDKLWRAPVPADIKHMRNLYINDCPAVRARSKCKYPCDEIYIDKSREETTKRLQYNDRVVDVKLKDGVIVKAENFPKNLSNVSDIEFVWSLIWTRQRTPVKEMKALEDGRILFIMQHDVFNTYHDVAGILPNQGAYFYIENAFEVLDEQGEFYFNREEGYVYYYPRENEDMQSADIFAGKIEGILNVCGTPDQKVKGIIFENLDIKYGAWDYVSEHGGFYVQADAMMEQSSGIHKSFTLPAQINFSHAEKVAVANSQISCLGSTAVCAEDDVSDFKLVGNAIYSISGCGIKVGTAHLPTSPNIKICENIAIENNIFMRIGGEYAGCCAITVYYASGCKIWNNTITDAAYTGISIGWGWGTTDPEKHGGFDVKYNKIIDVMQALNDGSHIYTLGSLRNSEIAYNYMSYTNDLSGGCGVYFDAGSGFINAHDNVIIVQKKSFTASSHHWIHNVNVSHFYANKRAYESPGDIHSIDYEPPVIISEYEPLPKEAQKIYDNSGVYGYQKQLYEDLVCKTKNDNRILSTPRFAFDAERIDKWLDAGDFADDINKGWFKNNPKYYQNVRRMFEGVCMEFVSEKNYWVVNETEKGEWLEYIIDTEKIGKGEYFFDIRCGSEFGPVEPRISIYLDDEPFAVNVEIPKTETYADLKYVKLGKIKLTERTHKMRVNILADGAVYSGFRFHNGLLYEK